MVAGPAARFQDFTLGKIFQAKFGQSCWCGFWLAWGRPRAKNLAESCFSTHDYSAVFYIQILNHNLTDIWESELMFMQNDASIHRVRKSKLWFQENGIKVMKWSSYSLDLNSIENLWALLKKKAYKVYSDLDSLKGKGDEAEIQLFHILQKAWVNIREKVIEGLISSMPRRCAAVIIAEGWHTKYWLGNHRSYTIK